MAISTLHKRNKHCMWHDINTVFFSKPRKCHSYRYSWSHWTGTNKIVSVLYAYSKQHLLDNSSVHQRATGMAILRYNMVSLIKGANILESVLHSRKANVQSEHLTRTHQHMLDNNVHQYATGRCHKCSARCSYSRPWSCLSHFARYSLGV